jgi:hypothetical protein
VFSGFGHDNTALVFADIRLSLNSFVDRESIFHGPQTALWLTGYPQKKMEIWNKTISTHFVDNKIAFCYPQMAL